MSDETKKFIWKRRLHDWTAYLMLPTIVSLMLLLLFYIPGFLMEIGFLAVIYYWIDIGQKFLEEKILTRSVLIFIICGGISSLIVLTYFALTNYFYFVLTAGLLTGIFYSIQIYGVVAALLDKKINYRFISLISFFSLLILIVLMLINKVLFLIAIVAVLLIYYLLFWFINIKFSHSDHNL